MSSFATHLIAFLVGAIAAALYGNYHLDRREVAAFEGGRHYEREMVARKHSERGKKAAATRRAKS